MRSRTMTAGSRGPGSLPVLPTEDAVKLTALRLQTDEVAVWRANLDDQPAEAVRMMHALMSFDEVERARGFFFDRDRRRYIVGRGILRLLLSRYLGCAAHELTFRYGAHGKPALIDANPGRAPASPLFFNVAHSEGLALYAFTRVGEIGVDVEMIRELPDWEQVAQAAFSPLELAQLQAWPEAQRRQEFFRAWTRQEAVLKALGTGLSEVPKAGGETAFNVYPLEAGPAFVAALAVGPTARRPAHVRGWTGGTMDDAAHQEFSLQNNLS
jgi:4'-phosphopantetheinyl transferase